jgi:hypothetical protein
LVTEAAGNSSLTLNSSKNATTGCRMTFSSNSTSDSYQDYVDITITYSWSKSSDVDSMSSFTDSKAAS